MVDFGLDVSTFPDLDRTFTLISGFRVVGEAIARRWMTPRGSFARDPAYGCDARGLLNETITQATLYRWHHVLTEQAEADERVVSANVSILASTDGRKLAITARVETHQGPFTMTLSIDKVSPATLEVLAA